MDDAYDKINGWMQEYNHFRPHSSLNEMTPAEFIDNYCQQEEKKITLPGASVDEHMHFATEKRPSGESKNTRVRQQYLTS